MPGEDERQIGPWQAIRRHVAQLRRASEPGDVWCAASRLSLPFKADVNGCRFRGYQSKKKRRLKQLLPAPQHRHAQSAFQRSCLPTP
jgi:hypothetical protein